jgi:hypothetical protein
MPNVRATYKESAVTGEYELLPSEVMVKERVNDINVKRGNDGLIFKSDFRISTSTEQKVPMPDKQGRIEQIRLKERYKYRF